MVQFWLGLHRSYPGVDEDYQMLGRSGYWRLGPQNHMNAMIADMKAFLQGCGFHHMSSISSARAIDLMARCQRGLLSYERYNVRELRKFVVARALPLNPTKMAQSKLVAELEKADDEATFKRFSDLPAELRNNIYALVFASYGEIELDYFQPPICRVSRQVREESLPLFYGLSIFKLDLRYNQDFPQESRIVTMHWYMASKYYLDGITAENVSRMRRFQLRVTMQMLVDRLRVDFTVDLRPARESGSNPGLLNGKLHRLVYSSTSVNDDLRDGDPDTEAHLLSTVKVVIDRIMSRPGLRK